MENISIHAARVGCDKLMQQTGCRTGKFQSTQPEWAATQRYNELIDSIRISIHAARVGCDKSAYDIINYWSQISIHAARVGCDIS